MDWLTPNWLWALFATTVWISGLLAAFHAVMSLRSERPAVAWCIGLLAMPVVAVAAYLIFGRRNFTGYHEAIARAFEEHETRIGTAQANMVPFNIGSEQLPSEMCRSIAAINRYPFSKNNHFHLLVDGEATFDAIAASIESTKEYILFQFFIAHDDELGRRMKQLLAERARAGVRVYFLYDEIGRISLPQGYCSARACFSRIGTGRRKSCPRCALNRTRKSFSSMIRSRGSAQ